MKIVIPGQPMPAVRVTKRTLCMSEITKRDRNLKAIIESRVLDIQGGSATIHFDGVGEIQMIVRKRHNTHDTIIYKREKK